MIRDNGASGGGGDDAAVTAIVTSAFVSVALVSVLVLSIIFGPHVLLGASNAVVLIPSCASIYLHRWTRAALYFFMIFASSFYHACNSWPGHCVFEATTSRKIDFFFAQLLIPVTALYIIKFPVKYAFIERWLIMAFALGLFVVEVFSNEPFIVQLIVAFISLALVFAYWIVFAIQSRRAGGEARLPTYDWRAFLMGIAMTSLACGLFVTQKRWHLGYPWVHTIWHTLAALGQYYILCIRNEAPRNAVMDARIWAGNGRGNKI